MGLVAPVVTRIGVVDVDRSVTYYRDILGFEVYSYRYEEGRLAWADVRFGDASLELARACPVADTPEQREARKGVSLIFEAPDIDGVHSRMAARGRPPAEIENRTGGVARREFSTLDPDGYTLLFVQPIPAEMPRRPGPSA